MYGCDVNPELAETASEVGLEVSVNEAVDF